MKAPSQILQKPQTALQTKLALLSMRLNKLLCICLLLISCHSFAQSSKLSDSSSLVLPPIFCNHMIVQREKPFLIWGKAGAKEKISIECNNETHTVVADETGNWKALFNKIKTGIHTSITIRNEQGKMVHVTDVVAGDVWVCAGQSNMNFMLAADKNGTAEIEQSRDDSLREYRCAMPEGAINPENTDHSQWVSANGEKLSRFSAVAYYFAKAVQNAQHIPVGIIVMSCGNTRAEAWTDTSFLKQYTALQPLLSYWQKKRKNKDALANFMPGKFYDDVVKPVIPFAIKGVVWYQGESNSFADNSGRNIFERTLIYKPLLSALISNWRAAWKDQQLPFYVIQLPAYKDTSGDLQWAVIRQAQLDVTKETPHTGLVVTIDVGDSTNIHPADKMPVGERAARWALVNEYKHKDMLTSGPLIQKAKAEDNKAVLYFTYTGDSLISKSGATLQGFQMADASDKSMFYEARAVIENNKVIVSAAQVSTPAIVRYAWADNPVASLYNSANLPASPFMIPVAK